MQTGSRGEGRWYRKVLVSAGYGNNIYVMGLKGMEVNDEGRDHDEKQENVR